MHFLTLFVQQFLNTSPTEHNFTPNSMCLLVSGEKQQINKYSTCWKITQLQVIILKQILEASILCRHQTKCAVEFGQQLNGMWQLQAQYSYTYTSVAPCTWCHWIKYLLSGFLLPEPSKLSESQQNIMHLCPCVGYIYVITHNVIMYMESFVAFF